LACIIELLPWNKDTVVWFWAGNFFGGIKSHDTVGRDPKLTRAA